MNNFISQNDFEKFKTTLSQFQILNDKDFELAFTFLTPYKLSKKEHFINFNQRITHLGFVIKGVFRTYYVNDKGSEITTCFCSENNFINSMQAALTQNCSTIAIQALESSDIIIISFDDINKLYSLSKNWLALAHHITQIGIINSFNSLKYFSEKEALDKYNDFMKRSPELVNRVPMQYLASYLGISKETLSRVRKKQTG